MAAHSSILDWRNPWTEEPGWTTVHGPRTTEPDCKESGHNWMTFTLLCPVKWGLSFESCPFYGTIHDFPIKEYVPPSNCAPWLFCTRVPYMTFYYNGSVSPNDDHNLKHLLSIDYMLGAPQMSHLTLTRTPHGSRSYVITAEIIWVYAWGLFVWLRGFLISPCFCFCMLWSICFFSVRFFSLFLPVPSIGT